MNAKVFINYRREDTAAYAGRLYDRLTAHFGEDQVFIDIDQIEPGEDFVEVINRKVGTCDIAIVAIGPNWLRATDVSGKRRLDDEEDFVRMEIVAALERKIRVIPVLVGGAVMPRRQDLPEALAPLSRRNAIELSEARFQYDVNRLIRAIEKPPAVEEEKPELSVGLISAIAAFFSKLRVPLKQRLIILTAVGATVILLLTIPSRPRPSGEKDYAEALKLATGLGGTRIDLSKAAKYLQRAAEKNVPEAEARLAYWVNNGVGGLAKDNVKAAQWTKKAFADGLTAKATNSVEAQIELAVLYEDGLGVSKDFGTAADLYQKAADQGNARAQNNLGLLYENGTRAPPGTLVLRDREKDWKKAAELYQKAADQGYASAQNHLGRLYQTGTGVTKDLGKAVELYQKAADQGYDAAQNNLGWLFQNGQGVTKDFGKAAELYQKAADQGNARAQYHLGLLYENGQGLPKDLGKAAELYQKAANQGDEDAFAALKRLSGHSK